MTSHRELPSDAPANALPASSADSVRQLLLTVRADVRLLRRQVDEALAVLAPPRARTDGRDGHGGDGDGTVEDEDR